MVPEEFPAQDKRVYDLLIAVARHGSTMTYSDVYQQCLGRHWGAIDIADKNKFYGTLGQISSFEKGKGRPMLSAVVVHAQGSPPIPGDSFFTLAHDLGFEQMAGETDVGFHRRLLNEVHTYWRQH